MPNNFLLTFIGLSFGMAAASAQTISFGAIGGTPLTTTTQFSNDSPRYTVGPSIEFRLPGRFAVEIDALYQRTSNSSAFTSIPAGQTVTSLGASTSTTSTQKGNAWQFPVLGKYYFGPAGSRWRVFAGTGFALTTTWSHTSGVTSILSGANQTQLIQSTPFSAGGRSPLDVGALVTAGVRYKKGRFALLPEFRYNYWGANSYPLRNNSAAFLLGFQF